MVNMNVVGDGADLGELKAEEKAASRNPSLSRPGPCERLQTALLPQAQPGLVWLLSMKGNRSPVNR